MVPGTWYSFLPLLIFPLMVQSGDGGREFVAVLFAVLFAAGNAARAGVGAPVA